MKNRMFVKVTTRNGDTFTHERTLLYDVRDYHSAIFNVIALSIAFEEGYSCDSVTMVNWSFESMMSGSHIVDALP